MKKFKKLLAVLLIVAAVCALTAVPASAASASGNGNGDGFNWSSSLTLNSTSATARMVVSKKPSGAAPAYFCAEVKGYVYSYNGGRSMISNSSGFVTGDTAIAVGSAGVSNASTAFCDYYAQGIVVGSLSLP